MVLILHPVFFNYLQSINVPGLRTRGFSQIALADLKYESYMSIIE